jgi:bifunctional DNA-binding transcriptional regulator/antitoxin component of YhaV-PrlF toxin-antitoxin module
MIRRSELTAFSRLLVNGRTVIPRLVRESLGLKAGDTLRYRLTGCGAILDKAAAAEFESFSCFEEWSGDADNKAYADL